MKIIEKTHMLKKYLLNFMARLAIFIGVLIFYAANKAFIYNFMTQPVWMGITPIHLLWLIFMVMMLIHIFPTEKLSMAIRKADEKEYVQQEAYSELELLQFVQKQNVRAWTVMLCWLSFNAIFGLLFLMGIIEEADLLLLTVFYFLCDYICILFFCPFQSVIMKNRCCVNCRIYEWGHFMMFTPMLFIPDFFSWSLFFTSCVVLIKWEIIYAKHPERFWDGSNKNLQCANCKDKICGIKRRITHITSDSHAKT